MRRICGCVVAAAVVCLPTAALTQAFVPQGPSPATGSLNLTNSKDTNGQGTAAGAIAAIVPDAVDPNTIYVATVGGGIWSTKNGGTTWTPLTDKQASLSMASLAADPTDKSGQTLIAGVGIVSNGALDNSGEPQRRGGARTGLLYTQNGGSTWTSLGATALKDQSVVGVLARGTTMLAATYEPQSLGTVATTGGANYGLYRSVNGGTSFDRVTTINPGPVTSVVGDPNAPKVLYAAMTSPTAKNTTAIYRSDDTGGNWQAVFNLATLPGGAGYGNVINNANQTVVQLATGPNGAIAAGFVNAATKQLAGLYLSTNSGQSWTALTLPNTNPEGGINPGAQGLINFAIAVDKTNPNIVYVAGDRQGAPSGGTDKFPNDIGSTTFSVSAWRLQLNPNGTTSLEALTDSFTADKSTTHADARAFAFDASGRLLMATDGGLSARTLPLSASGVWQGLNGNLQAYEVYSVAIDANSKRLVVAAQDNYTQIQSARGSLGYNVISGGDGTVAAVNDRSLANLGRSAIYTAGQNLGSPTRTILDANGKTLSSTDISFDMAIANRSSQFTIPFVLNRTDASQIAIGSTRVYLARDDYSITGDIELHLTDLGAVGGGDVSALAYGVTGAPQAVLVGTDGSRLYLSKDGTGMAGNQLTKYGGSAPTAVVFDPRALDRFYVADTKDVWQTKNGSAAPGSVAFLGLTADLPATFTRPTALEFVSYNGVQALFVGGVNNVANAQSPIAVADSNANNDLVNWRLFGTGLPNAIVSQLSYNQTIDTMAVGTWGRGVFVLYDVTAYFPTALALRFGLADNDSAPDAAFLTNGNFVSRSLEKVGIGTLTVSGNASYSGTTTINGGTMVVNGSIASSSGVFVNNGGTLRGKGTVASTTINAGATLFPGASIGTITVNGNLLFNPGSFYKVEVLANTADRASVTGTANLAGTASALFLSGPFTRNYTILSATGGRNGTFDAFSVSALPSALTATLGYTSTDVQLNLMSGLGQVAGLSRNQAAVGAALDYAFNVGGGLGSGFADLFNLSASALPGALTQLSGEPGAATPQVGFQSMGTFLGMLLDPFVDGRGAGAFGPALGFAPEHPVAPEIASAFAAVKAKPDAAPSFDRRWSAWGSSFGGGANIKGDDATGSHSTAATAWGFAAGVDYRVSPDTLVGAAIAAGETSWGLSAGLGGGRSDFFQAGVHGSTRSGPAYLSGALAAAWHRVSTNRTLTVSGTDKLAADFDATTVGARVETGYRFAMPVASVAPYAALQAQSFHTPSYGESATFGSSTFALAYNSQTTTATRSELGAWIGKTYALHYGTLLTLRGRAAWAHDFNTDRRINAAFQTLPGTSFTVDGAAPAQDVALVTAGGEINFRNGISLAARFTGEFASRSQSYSGTGTLRYTW